MPLPHFPNSIGKINENFNIGNVLSRLFFPIGLIFIKKMLTTPKNGCRQPYFYYRDFCRACPGIPGSAGAHITHIFISECEIDIYA